MRHPMSNQDIVKSKVRQEWENCTNRTLLYNNADVLLTTDRKFKNNCKRIDTFTKVMNPTEWLLEVLY